MNCSNAIRVILILTCTACLADPVRGQHCEAHEFQKLLPPADTSIYGFGHSACTINGNIAVVGTPGAPAARVYVYEFDGTNWILVAWLEASDGELDDGFGQCVTIADGTIIVGAQFDDNENGTDAGAAYVYVQPLDGWGSVSSPIYEDAKLLASDGEPRDKFGYFASKSGDVAVIGAYGDDNENGVDAGSAYVFVKPEGGWHSVSSPIHEDAKLIASGWSPGAQFGHETSIDGDVIVVGAYLDDNEKGINAGAAYVFVKPAGGWDSVSSPIREDAKLLASDGAPGDELAYGMSNSGDVVVVGAYRNDNENGTDAGAAYIYIKPLAGWGSVSGPLYESEKLIASDGTAGDWFGLTLSVSGDILVVGAHHDDDCGSLAGSAYVFRFDGTSWVEQAKLLASDCAAGDRFGFRVFVSAGVAVIGAFLDDNERGTNAGSAYMFHGLSDCNGNDALDLCDILDGTSTDENGNGVPGECDNEPPEITCNGPVVLWSPDHELVDVSDAISVQDPDGDEIGLSFRVFSDEPEIPETGDGTGRHCPDFKDEYPDGRGLLVRSERRGREDGRYYIVIITADDGNGGLTTGVCAAAVVPHDQDEPSLNDVLTQADDGVAAVQAAIEAGDPLPPPGFYEHGLADPLGPKQ